MPLAMASDSSATLYTALNSEELERLPKMAVIHHATWYDKAAGLPLRGVLFNPELASLCDQPLNVVIPLPFRLDDPHACPRCLEVVPSGHAK